MAAPYSDYVSRVALQNPSLGALSSFLEEESEVLYSSSIQYAEVEKYGKLGSSYKSSAPELVSRLNSRPTKSILAVVENISRKEIELFGSALGIDPFFFCGHIASSYSDIEKSAQSPLLGLPPSQIVSQGFLNIHYQKVLDLGDESASGQGSYRLNLVSNVPRSVRRLPALSGRSIGLLRGCVSLIKHNLGDDLWICIVLVDPASDLLSQSSKARISQIPRRIVPESPRVLPSYKDFHRPQDRKLDYQFLNPCEELMSLYETLPPGWNVGMPSILSLSWYPIQGTIREWILYGCLISRYVKYYEYSFPTVLSRLEHFEKTDILELHRWRRRSQQTLHKLQMIRLFVEHWRTKETGVELCPRCTSNREKPSETFDSWGLLLIDIKHLQDQIAQHAQSLEALNPIMTSLVQLLDSHKSIAQAEDVRRLTYIAIAFVPLSYITGIFSMGDSYIPGGEHFWVYWATAVPIAALIVGFLAFENRFPSAIGLWAKIKGRRKDSMA